MNTASDSGDGRYARANASSAGSGAVGSSSTIPPPPGTYRAFANTFANVSDNTTRDPRTVSHAYPDQPTRPEPGNGQPPNGHNTPRPNNPANRPASNRPTASVPASTTTRTRGRTSSGN